VKPSGSQNRLEARNQETAMEREYLLQVENLSVHYATRAGDVSAVDDLSFALARGEVLGIAGESGCGKTTLALSLLRLLPENGRVLRGRVILGGTDLLPLSAAALQPFRWRRMAIVFQNAMNSLHPVYRVGDQVCEVLREREAGLSRREASRRAAELFAAAGMERAMLDGYPHESSGGMRQRAAIAMALAGNPELLIADEPTTGLDVIVQAAILREIRVLQESRGMSMICISHDLAMLAESCGRMAVMYAGRLAELGTSAELFDRSLHPYTRALQASFPSLRGPLRRLSPLPLEPPSLLRPPSGCRFHPRCPRAREICPITAPEWKDYGGGHCAACWNPVEDA
jgi:peptide/nickel transport system ATP-binding protein